ncbi:MAG: tyrosine-type recombinase/integrase [Bdellovibrionales bacterium]|nr:tyrosine-type recombinase/integrase [Bdellovibrionales bacterium]
MGDAKLSIGRLTRLICREVRRHNFTYHQLNYIFRSVRANCLIEVPGRKPNKLFELPTQQEREAFFNAIHDPAHCLLFTFLLSTGVREAEACNLQVKHLDLDDNKAFIFEGKGKKDRVVIFSEKLKHMLSLYLKDRNHRFVFQSNRHTRYTMKRVQQLCQRYKEKAGISCRFTPHVLRHIHMTKLAEAGVSKERRALLAGHSNELM